MDKAQDRDTLGRLMRTRFSCRAFLPDPIAEETIARIVDAARWSASWSNTQPWDMLVTQPQTTQRLAETLTVTRLGVPPPGDDPFAQFDPPEVRS